MLGLINDFYIGEYSACKYLKVHEERRREMLQLKMICSLWFLFKISKQHTPPRHILFSVGDGRLGYPDEAPYDAIHVGAAAPTVPEAVSLSSL